MKLLSLYRRKVFLPWLILGVIFAALIIFFLVVLEREAYVVAISLGGLYILCLLISTIRAFSGWGTRGYRKYLQTLSLGEQEILYDQYKEGFRFYHAVLTENCIILLNRQFIDAMPYEHIVWVYDEQVYGNRAATASTARVIAVGTDDKKLHRIPLRPKDSKHLKSFLDRILERNPGIILGYDRKTAELFKKNVDQLADQVRLGRSAVLNPRMYSPEASKDSPASQSAPSQQAMPSEATEEQPVGGPEAAARQDSHEARE